MSLLRVHFAKSLQQISIITEFRHCYSIQTVKPHVPLIKFRKGGPISGDTGASGSSPLGSVSGHASITRGTIEDYQLPPRYQRTPMDEKEIDYINRGGPE